MPLSSDQPNFRYSEESSFFRIIITYSSIFFQRGIAASGEGSVSVSSSPEDSSFVTLLEDRRPHVLHLGTPQQSDLLNISSSPTLVSSHPTTTMPYLPLLDLGPSFSASKIADEASERTTDASTTNQSPTSGQSSRLKTSPRMSSPSTGSSSPHVSFDLRVGEAETMYLSSGEQSPIRGRTLRRVPARDRTDSRSSVLDQWIAKNRLMSRDLTQTPEQYFEDALLEPRPFGRIRSHSISEEIQRAASIDDPIDFTRFIGHRDTFGLIRFNKRKCSIPELPDRIFTRLACHVDLQSYKAIRLTCRHWSRGITRARPIIIPPSMRLPVEVLERIYTYTEPHGFNSARHACRSWMIASLEQNLLARMLQTGGWWNALQLDMARFECGSGRRLSTISHNWLLSKRLATECALSTKPGLSYIENIEVGEIPNKYKDPDMSPLSLTSKVDFSELARDRRANNSGDPSLRFEVSICQKYVMVLKGSLIHVYALHDQSGTAFHEFGGHFRTITVLECPGRVLSASMDTSFDRLAVAALLEDRVGMVHELRGRPKTPDTSVSSSTQLDKRYGTPIELESDELPIKSPNRSGSWKYRDGPRRVYRSVCTGQDPPRSVAICPQRRCVAFGNGKGIEVHWIDALNGQNLQRWFPISSPSDCLYFLPNRIGIDSIRKLRIIASTWHSVQSQIECQQYPHRMELLKKVEPFDDYTTEDQAWKLNWAFSPMSYDEKPPPPDHNNARPLSDGNTYLFTDALSGRLILGSDEHVDQGVPSFLHRYVFVGPKPHMVPFTYSSAIELQWGVRVVAAYADCSSVGSNHELWLFSVPPDDFFSDRNGVIGDTDSARSVADVVAIAGVHVATVSSLSAVAIDATEGDLTVRAFSIRNGGEALTWQLAASGEIINKAVRADGITIPGVTERRSKEDLVMQDTQKFLPLTSEIDFDGARSPTSTGNVTGVPSISFLEHQQNEVDADGDTRMLDAPLVPQTKSSQQPATPPSSPSSTPPPPPPPIFWRDGRPGTDAQREDEGYDSAQDRDNQTFFDVARNPFTIYVPPLHGHWSETIEWVPQYLAEHGTGIEDEGLGIDVVEACRMEVEIVELSDRSRYDGSVNARF